MGTDHMILPEKPDHQSNESWLQEYDTAAVYRQASCTTIKASQMPPKTPQPTKDTLIGSFQYMGHRTTKVGRLVLEFIHIDTGEIACRFFNVEIESTRNRMYRAGNGGQFTTRKGHRFRRFWLYVFDDKPPRRWSRVHLELHKLRAVAFIGTAKQKHAANSSYWNLTDLRKRR